MYGVVRMHIVCLVCINLNPTCLVSAGRYNNTLAALDTTKATGPDEIPPIVLSTCASALYKPLHHLFCLCLDLSDLPYDWKIHKVVPIR